MIWDNLREEEFEGAIKSSGGLCVIPLGCLEKHGQHLPVGTDYIEAMTIVKAAAEIEDVVIFPVGAWLGEVSCFHSFSDPGAVRLRGCIGIKQSTILTVLEELCDEIARNGFNKILIVNNHGGNIHILNHFLRCQSYYPKPYATMLTFGFSFADMEPQRLLCRIMERREEFSYITKKDIEVLKKYSKTGYGGGHGDFRETAVVMAADESLVAKDRYDAECGISNGRTDYLKAWGIAATNDWLANYPASYNGFPPFECSKAIGEAMVKICAEKLAKKFKLIKEDGDCVRSAQMLPKE
jgi:creatinine amidohydrolase